MDALYFAAGDRIYRQPAGQAPEVLLKYEPAQTGEVGSMALDAVGGALYLSTAKLTMSLALAGSGAGFRLVKGIGGIARVRDGKLYLLDEKTKDLLALSRNLLPRAAR